MNFGRVVLILIILLFSLFSCSKKVSSNEPESVLRELALSYKNSPLKFYSKNTVSSIEKAIRLNIVDKNNVNSLLYDFSPEVRYDILKKKKDGKNVKLYIKYTSHSIENRTGQIAAIKFIFEDEKWSIDKSSDIIGLIKANDNSAVKSYVDSKFSKY